MEDNNKKGGNDVDSAVSSDDRYRALFDNSADAILIIEGNKFIDCNEATVRMLRCGDKQTLFQTHPSELSPEYQPDGRRSYEKANEMMAIAMDKGSHRFEWDHIRADGEVFPVEVLLTVIPPQSGSGKEPQIHTVWRDITERKQLEKQLRHSQKMEAVGKLTGGIAHDFNNQLVPILGYCELLSKKLPQDSELYQYVDEINRAGTRAANLVQKLMAFSRKDIDKEVTIDLNKVINSLLSMLGKVIGEDIIVNFQPAEQSLPLSIAPGNLEQIILNLATNSRDALPSGGKITIRTRSIQKNGQPFVCFDFEDNGVGMDANTMAQIFVPFFTTKGLGAGTGLGLSGAYDMINAAKGSIEVSSRPGQGTSFQICFPRSSKPETNIYDASPLSSEQHSAQKTDIGKAHILVVDDDKQIADLVQEVLIQAGYEVIKAGSGEDALEILADLENDNKKTLPDLILCDVILSGMSGPLMVKSLQERGVSIEVLFMSGYTDDRLAKYGFDRQQVNFLNKPFTPTELRQHVEKVLLKRSSAV